MALDPSVPRSIPYVRRRGSQLTVFLEYRRYGSFSVPCASQTSLPTFQKGEAELCASFPLRSHWISLRRCRSQWNTCVIRGVRSPRLVLCDKKIGFGHSFLLIMASSLLTGLNTFIGSRLFVLEVGRMSVLPCLLLRFHRQNGKFRLVGM